MRGRGFQSLHSWRLFCTATIILGLAECPLSRSERLQLSVSWRLKCTRRMLKSNGAFHAVHFTEVVRILEGLLRDVPLYIDSLEIFQCMC